MTHNNARRADRRFKLDLIAAAAALVLMGISTAATAQDAAATNNSEAASNATAGDAPVRRSFSAEGFKNRGATTLGKSKARSLPATKARAAKSRNADTGFGVYDGFAEIYFDDDADGFFYGLDVFFDVDTDFASAFVYAALYLSRNGGPWELYYTTADFEINGAIADDEYLVETELFEGYPTDSYDVLVEVYDADFGDFVAEFGPADSAALALLPLEDQIRDTPVTVGSGFVAVGGGGGAMGVSLIALGLLAFARRRFSS